jgi:translation initiation factor IF-3
VKIEPIENMKVYSVDSAQYEIYRGEARAKLLKGNKLKVICNLRGRQLPHAADYYQLFERLVSDLGDVALLVAGPKREGKTIWMVFEIKKNG